MYISFLFHFTVQHHFFAFFIPLFRIGSQYLLYGINMQINMSDKWHGSLQASFENFTVL